MVTYACAVTAFICTFGIVALEQFLETLKLSTPSLIKPVEMVGHLMRRGHPLHVPFPHHSLFLLVQAHSLTPPCACCLWNSFDRNVGNGPVRTANQLHPQELRLSETGTCVSSPGPRLGTVLVIVGEFLFTCGFLRPWCAVGMWRFWRRIERGRRSCGGRMHPSTRKSYGSACNARQLGTGLVSFFFFMCGPPGIFRGGGETSLHRSPLRVCLWLKSPAAVARATGPTFQRPQANFSPINLVLISDDLKNPLELLYHTFQKKVGAYAGLVKERFERCLDLYLCPRAFKRRLNIDPESLVPRLPRPRELKPFPNALCVEYKGHAASVRCIACSGDGQWMATGDDDGVLILWEVRSMGDGCCFFGGAE